MPPAGATAELTAAARLARWVVGLTLKDIPVEVATLGRLLIADVMGVGIAALSDRAATPLRRWTQMSAGNGACTALGMGRGLSGSDAAFVNGSLMHALDFDDMGFGGHATSCVYPAAVAAAELVNAPDELVLTGYLTGLEAFGQLARATDVNAIHEYGFHPTGVFGIIGATVAAGKILNLGETELMHALAIAASEGVGITANFGSMSKPMHAGHAAAMGIKAVQLAQAGLQGRPRIFEEPEGFGTAYMRDKIDWEGFLGSLGSPFRMTFAAPTIKQYPCCGGNQRSIESLRSVMRQHNLTNEQIVAVRARIHRRVLTVLRYDWPQDEYEGKFSLRFNLALTLVDGRPALGSYTRERVREEAVMAAGRKITVEPVDSDDRHGVVAVFVRTLAGQEYSAAETVLPGSSKKPMTDQQIHGKFVVNVGRVLDDVHASALWRGITGESPSDFALLEAWRGLRNASPGEASASSPSFSAS